MFRVKHLDWEEYMGPTALSFVDPEETGVVVHDKIEGDGRESCAEYKRRVVDKVATNQSWCRSCADIFVDMMIGDDCQRCWEDVPHKEWHGSLWTYSMDKPESWSLQDECMQQLQKTPVTFGESELDQCPSTVDNTDGVGLKTLGLSPGCPICFKLARCMLSAGKYHGRLLCRKIQMRPRSEHRLWGANSPNVISIDVIFGWYEEGVRDGIVSGRIWEFGGSSVLHLSVRDFAKEPTLLHYELNRCNAGFLKREIQVQFEVYPDENLQQAAEYPESFRLIDVNQKCVVDIRHKHVRYSAISYRWYIDNDEILADENMLTEDTKSFFAVPGSLTPETMSKTLYDCVRMAQLLEIPYIWIDRFCIIQGDKAERAEHIQAMGDIYANSYLTMFCALAKYSEPGLPGYTRDFDGRLEESGNLCRVTAERDPSYIFESTDWFKRAFTLQEEYLSPRRLYFTESNIFWHINCPMVGYHHADSAKTPDCRPICARAHEKSVYDLIQEYSRRKPDIPTDRIDAISGLLKTRGIEHVFGMPTRSMHHALFWRTTSQYPKRIIDFPSWSWANSDGIVEFGGSDKHHRPLCRILHSLSPLCKRISFSRQSGFPTSMLPETSGRQLVIRAWVRPIRRSECHRICYDFEEYPIASTCLVVLMSMSWQAYTYFLSLIVEPFSPPGAVYVDDVVHARRVGRISERSPSVSNLIRSRNIAKLRPMAIQTLTRLKSQRLRNLRPRRKRTIKNKRPRMSNPYSQTWKSKAFAATEGSGDLNQARPKIQPATSFEPTGAIKRKRSESPALSEPYGERRAILRNTQARITKRRKYLPKSIRRKKGKPVPRPFLGNNVYKDYRARFRTIILH